MSAKKRPAANKPEEIEVHADFWDRLTEVRAYERAIERGRSEKEAKQTARRALRDFQRKPLVSAETTPGTKSGATRGVARFWARVYIDADSLRGLPFERRLWRVHGTIARASRGRLVVDEVAIRPWGEPGPEPTTAVLRALRVTELRALALEELRNRSEFVAWMEELEREAARTVLVASPEEREAILAGADLAGPEKPRRGRSGGGADFYSRLAADAVLIASTGQAVYATLASQRGTDTESVRRWIRTARRKKVLDPKGNVWRLGPMYGSQEKEEED